MYVFKTHFPFFAVYGVYLHVLGLYVNRSYLYTVSLHIYILNPSVSEIFIYFFISSLPASYSSSTFLSFSFSLDHFLPPLQSPALYIYWGLPNMLLSNLNPLCSQASSHGRLSKSLVLNSRRQRAVAVTAKQSDSKCRTRDGDQLAALKSLLYSSSSGHIWYFLDYFLPSTIFFLPLLALLFHVFLLGFYSFSKSQSRMWHSPHWNYIRFSFSCVEFSVCTCQFSSFR